MPQSPPGCHCKAQKWHLDAAPNTNKTPGHISTCSGLIPGIPLGVDLLPHSCVLESDGVHTQQCLTGGNVEHIVRRTT